MNQDSLNHYKSQVYNPGSPHPSPVLEPFKTFPKDQSFSLTKKDPQNPLKITFSAKRKRDSSSEIMASNESPTKSPAKKLKMLSTEDTERFFDNLTKKFEERQDKVNAAMIDDMGAIKSELASLRTAQEKSNEDSKKEKDNLAEHFKTIESRLDQLESSKTSSSPTPPSPNFFNTTSDNAWKANLAKDVFLHDHGLVIHGFKLEGNDDKARTDSIKHFFKTEMKADNDLLGKVRIKEVIRLGADNDSKPPPVLVKFGHPTERNSILPLSKNLRRGLTLDKFVPKMYLQKHKEFKRHAWKLKSMFNVQSQVVFEAHNLVVRYKKKDDGTNKYNWVIAKEFHPQPEDSLTLSRTEARDPSKLDTPIIDMSCNSACNRSVIVTGIPDIINNINAELEFRKYIDSKDENLIETVDFKSKGTLIIACRDWAACKHISDTYQDIKMSEKKLTFTLFSENDPSA